jgi:hypothetical protein
VAILAELENIIPFFFFFSEMKKKRKFGGLLLLVLLLAGWRGEWQWLGGSGINRRGRSMRFEWYRLESGSGSIGRVTRDITTTFQFCSKKQNWGYCLLVAVAGWHGEWQWHIGSGTNRQTRSARFEWYQLEHGSGSIDTAMTVSTGGSGCVAVTHPDRQVKQNQAVQTQRC